MPDRDPSDAFTEGLLNFVGGFVALVAWCAALAVGALIVLAVVKWAWRTVFS